MEAKGRKSKKSKPKKSSKSQEVSFKPKQLLLTLDILNVFSTPLVSFKLSNCSWNSFIHQNTDENKNDFNSTQKFSAVFGVVKVSNFYSVPEINKQKYLEIHLEKCVVILKIEHKMNLQTLFADFNVR
jgi:hypothetical protein